MGPIMSRCIPNQSFGMVFILWGKGLLNHNKSHLVLRTSNKMENLRNRSGESETIKAGCVLLWVRIGDHRSFD